MRNVIFDNATIEGDFGGKYYNADNLSFKKTKLKWVYFFFNELKNSIFTGLTKSSKVVFSIESLMDNCLLEGKKANLEMNDSPQKNCKYVGSFYSLKIRGISGNDFIKLTKEKREKTIADVKNKMENIDFTEADLYLPEFGSYLFLENIKVSDRNILVKMTVEFYKEVLAQTQKLNPADKDKLSLLFEIVCKPHQQTPYAVYHAEDWNKLTTEQQALYFNILKHSAEKTNCLIKN